MIIEFMFDILKAMLLKMIDMIPSLSVFQQIGSMAGLIELIANASYFVPFSTLFICLGVWVVVQQAQFVMSIINWIIGKIPTVS